MNTILTFLLMFFSCVSMYEYLEVRSTITPLPYIVKEEINPVKEVVKSLGCPKGKVEEVTKAVELASEQTNLNPFLLSVLMFTESNFNFKAESEKGYKGLMQTPTATKQWADVDVLHGARILQDKLKIAKGNLLKALSLYKGGENQLAKKQARQVLGMYKQIMDRRG